MLFRVKGFWTFRLLGLGVLGRVQGFRVALPPESLLVRIESIAPCLLQLTEGKAALGASVVGNLSGVVV